MKKCSTSLSHKVNTSQNNTEIPSHPSQNGCHHENNQQMLVRTLGKGTFMYCWWKCKLVQPLWKPKTNPEHISEGM
jgi:hypothetical protein